MRGAERGQVVDGRFELLRRLGRGGMGTVWCARDLALHREVALKEVRPAEDMGKGAPSPEVLRERVLREARALARLSHPHVVRIYHIVDVRPYPWLVMELLPGESLHDRAEAGPVAPADAIRWGRDVLAALRAAHAAGIHHRDVKPANIMLREDGSAVLTDFGIAALAGSTGTLTVTGAIVGSPEYLAPERVRGAPDHPAADLWSLGITLYVLTEGHSPLRRGTTLATLTAVLEEPVPPPVRSGPLTATLGALLRRDPALRPDAEAVERLLGEAARLAEAGPAVPRTPTSPDLPRPAPPAPPQAPPAPGAVTGPLTPPGGGRARRAPLAVAAAGVLLLLGVGAAWLLRDGGGDDARPDAGPSERATVPEEPEETAEKTDDGGGAPEEPEEDEEPPDPVESETETEEPEETGDRWVAQLLSEPVGTGTRTRDERLAAVRTLIPEAQVLRSDDYASLNPGYWVIYAPGPFADGREAVARCAEAGLITKEACVGRYLSQDPDDVELVCDPVDGGSGRCDEDD
ncbi:Serine/threonine protein kinase [Streptomyces zhaozhouensis]|uniref:non-specific serine/threonine protein kinase n=1 Tax=Streptomyces zhaozhouensis TaxID=1300267 RepID=A0A286DJ65_9ACTN|nr:serine/threonine-protein kinase [Streptomyces zhaozhouensis]SOD58649.1 Serine/threonine protein kinase [Streptomyces zhaozhouensis]